MMELKQDKMTHDERYIALLNRAPVDRVAIIGLALGFASLTVGDTIGDAYYDPKKRFEADERTSEMYGWQRWPRWGLGSWPCEEFGGDLIAPEGYRQSPLPVFPVITDEDAWNLKKPDVRTAGKEHIGMEVAKMADQRGDPYILTSTIQGPWSAACMLTGVAWMCKAAKKRPEVAHHLVKIATAYCIDKVRWFAETFGPERVIATVAHTSSTNQIIGPKIFEEFVFPYVLELYNAILAIGVKHTWCHICGNHSLNYPMWAQVPMGDPGIVSVAHDTDDNWTTPLESVSKLFPNDILFGNIEPATIHMGTPAQVYELSRECIEIGMKHEAGFILAPGCEMPPNAPPYNVWMMTKAVNDFGWYT